LSSRICLMTIFAIVVAGDLVDLVEAALVDREVVLAVRAGLAGQAGRRMCRGAEGTGTLIVGAAGVAGILAPEAVGLAGQVVRRARGIRRLRRRRRAILILIPRGLRRLVMRLCRVRIRRVRMRRGVGLMNRDRRGVASGLLRLNAKIVGRVVETRGEADQMRLGPAG